MTTDRDVLDELRASACVVIDRAAATRRHADPWEAEPTDEQLWRQAIDLGWTGLLVDERHGGAEAGMTATVVVLEELARRVTTVPYLSSAVLGASAFALVASPAQQDSWLPAIASGGLRVAVAATGAEGRPGVEHLTARATRAARDGWTLSGGAGFVLDGGSADAWEVAARLPGGETGLFAVERGRLGVNVAEALNVDRSRRCASIGLDAVALPDDALLGGTAVDGLDRLQQRAGLALAADAVGVARRALELAVTYAGEREQFGRPIGSFQAIKHKLADMYVLVQGSIASVAAAARAMDDSAPDAGRLVAVAASYARDAATKVTGDAIQVHGGIGYTWEHECHRLFRRAVFDELFLRPPASFRDDLADIVLAPHRAAS